MPRSQRPLQRNPDDFLAGGGEMGELIRRMDWSQTPLGPIESWPQSLRTTVSLCLASNFPIAIAWGPKHTQIYNDGYRPICGAKHPHSMGQDFTECRRSAWPAIGEAFERATAGESAFLVNQRMFLDRYGYLEETFFTFSLSPIRDESGGVAGLFHPVTEMTQQTLAERRLKALRDLADRTSRAKSVAEASTLVVQALAGHEPDLPFVLLYLLDADGKQARLAGKTGLPDCAAAPKTVDLTAPPEPCWPLTQAAGGRQPVQVNDVEQRFGTLACGPYPEPPHSAFVLPIHASGLPRAFGLLVAGVSSRRVLDEGYRTFYLMLREAATNALTNAFIADIPFGKERLPADRIGAARTIASTGLQGESAGDDLFKPFSARELLARVKAHLDITRMRRDVNEALRESEARLAAETTALARLNDSGTRLWRAQSRQEGLDEMLGATIELLSADMGDVHVLKDGRDTLAVAARRGFGRDFVGAFNEVSPHDRSPYGEAVRSRQRVVVENAEADETFPSFGSIARSAGYKAMQCTPLIARDGALLGILSTYFRSPHRPSPQDLLRLDLYARRAADFMERFGKDEERERLLQREQAARTQAEEASRIKDEFLATVSHEVRTPLNAILGWAQLLQSGSLDAQKTKQALDSIYRNAKSQAQIIEDLLDVSRIITGKLKLETSPVDLRSVIHAAIDSLRPAIHAKAITLRTSLQANLAVFGDANRLQQVLWNLLSNAVKFSPSRGIVQIRTLSVDSKVRISVIDKGAGIKPEFLPYLFQRFTQQDPTATRRHGGLGLGLAIVRHVVELHGGSVSVESEGEGRGSTFTVELPIAAGARQPAPRRENAARAARVFNPPPQLAGLRVLLVDDEPDTLAMIETALEYCKCEVRMTQSAGEALSVLEAWRPDVLISDIAMPGEDGYALIRRIRSLTPQQGSNVPAVALTAYARVEDRAKVLAAGFQVHVPKPVEPGELVDTLAGLLRERWHQAG